MTNTVRMRGEAPFPVAGEGVVLRFNNADCSAFQAKYEDNWFVEIINRVDRSDMACIQFCVERGAKKDGKTIKVDFDDLDMPVTDVGKVILDALFLAMHGRTFEDHVAYVDSMKAVAVTEADSGNE